MEDATKAWAYLRPGVGLRTGASPVESPEPLEPELGPSEDDRLSVGERRHNRWFTEERKGESVPKRLEIPNEVVVTSGGPLKMTGNITLIDEDGSVSHANQLSLCRCGASQSKPLCDENHVEIEFLDNGRFDRASDCMAVKRPQNVTVTVVKDGPLKFRGYLKIRNRKGQECTTMQGALCRCGRSAKKPFCDCQ